MSTRGLYGFRKNGIDKCTYNHCDSYPDWLGREVLEFCATNNIDKLSRLFDNIELVSENSTPTEKQIEICKKEGYINLNVSSQSVVDTESFSGKVVLCALGYLYENLSVRTS